MVDYNDEISEEPADLKANKAVRKYNDHKLAVDLNHNYEMRNHGYESTKPRKEDSRHRKSEDSTEKIGPLNIDKNTFMDDDPKHIAAELKRAAELSSHQKGAPRQLANETLDTYIQMFGKNLSPQRVHTLQESKAALKKLFAGRVYR